VDLYAESLMGLFACVLFYLIIHYGVLPRAPILVKIVVAVAVAALLTARQAPAPFDYTTSGVAAFVATIAAGYPWRHRPIVEFLAFGLAWGLLAAYLTRAIPDAFYYRRWWSWIEATVTLGLVYGLREHQP